MDHAWLYRHLPEAEKRQHLPEADHTFSQSFERRMQGIFYPDPIKRMVSFGQKVAAVLLAVICVSGILLCEPVRGWVGEVFVSQDQSASYLFFDFSDSELDQEIRHLPDNLLGVYCRNAKRRLNRAGTKYAVDYADSEGYAFSIIVDGRGKGINPLPNAIWQSCWIGGVNVQYTMIKGQDSAQEVCAYWAEDDVLMIVEGKISKNTLLQIAKQCIGMEE